MRVPGARRVDADERPVAAGRLRQRGELARLVQTRVRRADGEQTSREARDGLPVTVGDADVDGPGMPGEVGNVGRQFVADRPPELAARLRDGLVGVPRRAAS